jgi:probable rRNA maturation factor
MISNKSAKRQKSLQFKIQTLNRQRRYKIDSESAALFCCALLDSLDRQNETVSVVFIGAEEMRALNRQYLNRDYSTDVLSFGYGAEEMDGMPFLGEIFISPEAAVKQAVSSRMPPDAEIRTLITHGMLHLLGYDHETDKGEMMRFQKKLLRRKFFTAAPPLLRLKAN